MKKHLNKRLGMAVCVLAFALTISGCSDKEKGKEAEDTMQQEVSKNQSENADRKEDDNKESKIEKENANEKEDTKDRDGSQGGSQSEENNQNPAPAKGLKGTYEYTSSDGKITIVLPDSSWRCIADGDGMLSFSSDAGAIDVLNLGSADLENSVMAETQEAFEKELDAAGKSGYQVLSFQYEDKDNRRDCKSVIQYPQDADFNYEITFTSITNGQGYEVKGLLKTADQELVEKVKNGIFETVIS